MEQEKKELKELPKESGLPLVGSMFKYSKHRVEFIEELIDKHGSKFEFSLGGKKVVVIHGQKHFAVFYDEQNITRTQLLPQQKDLLGGGSDKICLYLDGQEHIHRKKFLLSLLDSKCVQEYIPVMDRIILDVLNGWSIEKNIAVSERFLDITTQLNLKVLLGCDHDHYLKLKDKFRKRVARLVEGFEAKIPSHNPVSTYGKALKAVDKLNQLFNSILTKREKEIGDSTKIFSSIIDNFVVKYKQLPSDLRFDFHTQIREFTHFTNAITSLGSFLPHLFVYLGKHPHVIEKAVEEIVSSELFKGDPNDDSSSKISLEALDKLPYLHQLVKELLRCGPSVPALLPTYSKQDFDVGGYKVPKNTIVLGSLYTTNHDPRVYKDADNFDPERFSHERNEDGKAECPALAWVPFGGGDPNVTHRCGGELFVRIFLKLFLCRLLCHFSWELEKDQDLEVDWSSFKQQPKDGVKIQICRKF